MDTAHGMSSGVPDLAQMEVVIQPAPLPQTTVQQPIQQLPATQQGDRHDHVMVKDPIASQDPTKVDTIASQDSTYVDRQVQFRTADNNILLSPKTLTDTVTNASKEGVVGNEEGQPPQPPLQQQEDHRQDPESDLGVVMWKGSHN